MKSDNDELKITYNKIAKDWNNDHKEDTWWIGVADDFLSLLSPNATILDIGCGGGYKTKYIKDKGFQAEGIDFSEEMIRDAKENFPDITFEVVDLYDLEKFPKTFDGIFAQAVLLHIPKKRIVEVLKKLKSKLNKGGLLYVAVKEARDSSVEEEIKKENDYGYEYERFFSYFNINELKNYFKDIDLEVVSEKIITSGKTNWINVVGRK